MNVTLLSGSALSVIGVLGQTVQPAFRKIVPLVLDFTGANNSVTVDLSQQTSQGLFDVVRSLYLDNSTNPSGVTITVPSTGQIINTTPYSTGWYPISGNAAVKLIFTSVGGATAVDNCQLFNYENSSSVQQYSPGGPGSAVTIADGADVAEGARAQVAITDPTATASVIQLLKGLLTVLGGAGYTPIALLTSTVAVANTPVTAAHGPANGGFITNPPSATESLFVDMVGNPNLTGLGTTVELVAGQTFLIPKIAAGVSVKANAATGGHAYTGETW